MISLPEKVASGIQPSCQGALGVSGAAEEAKGRYQRRRSTGRGSQTPAFLLSPGACPPPIGCLCSAPQVFARPDGLKWGSRGRGSAALGSRPTSRALGLPRSGKEGGGPRVGSSDKGRLQIRSRAALVLFEAVSQPWAVGRGEGCLWRLGDRADG